MGRDAERGEGGSCGEGKWGASKHRACARVRKTWKLSSARTRERSPCASPRECKCASVSATCATCNAE